MSVCLSVCVYVTLLDVEGHVCVSVCLCVCYVTGCSGSHVSVCLSVCMYVTLLDVVGHMCLSVCLSGVYLTFVHVVVVSRTR